ncbi:formin-J-like [Hydractinia symbiolongicarpus]|uniref:formin-J-like n=1 Tax=Hydractinia symbiolongicarpus TaxID=13093 RepID=UPI00254B40CC|nr:formin-J-like [Hydractinia symbiolongicarpus]
MGAEINLVNFLLHFWLNKFGMSWPELYGFTLKGNSPVVVVAVKEGSEAQQAGLLPGDQIIKVGDVNVQEFTEQQVILLAQTQQHTPPIISVISRIIIVDLNRGANGYGLQFKGLGPVYISAVQPNSPAYHLGIHPGDMLVEINGIRVSKASKASVDKLVAKHAPKLHLVLIAGAVNVERNRWKSKPTFSFSKVVNYYLAGENEKKRHLMLLLQKYITDRNIGTFSYGLIELLKTPLHKRLLKFIRPYLLSSHCTVFDRIIRNEHHVPSYRKRMVLLKRRSQFESLGLVLRNTLPVTVHNVVKGSAAHLSGLAAGDKLLEVDGRDVRGYNNDEIVHILKNSGVQFQLLVRNGSKKRKFQDKIQALSGDCVKESLGGEFKEQIMMRLTHGEQLVLRQTLVHYLQHKDLKQLFTSLEEILDEPYKLQLLHYLGQLFPIEMLPTFEQYAVALMAKQTESCHDNDQHGFDDLKLYHSPFTKKRRNNPEFATIDEEITSELVNEKDVGNIEKGSTLDILLSLDDNTLRKLKQDVTLLTADSKVLNLGNNLVETTAQIHLKGNNSNNTNNNHNNNNNNNNNNNSNNNIDARHRVPYNSSNPVGSKSVHASNEEESLVEKVTVHFPETSKKENNHFQDITKINNVKYPIPPKRKGSLNRSVKDLETIENMPNTQTGNSPLTLLPPPPLPPPPPTAPSASHSNLNKNAMQLKRLNWEKISGKSLQNTVWSEINDASVNEIINFSEIEELFVNKPAKSTEKKSEKRMEIMCSKKSHSLGILVGHLKLSTEKIYDAVLEMDFSVLSPAHVRTLLTCAPDQQEASELEEADENHLVTLADKFTKQMLKVTNYEKRLRSMLFKSEFYEKIKELEPDIASVLEACRQLQHSKNLRYILEIVLATGNFLNKSYKSISGASAFKISFLSKLSTTKTSDNKSNLLSVIVNTLLVNKPDVLLIQQELQSVPRAAKISSQLIKQEIEELKKGMRDLEDELRLAKLRDDHRNDKFARVMGQFVNEAHHSFHELLTQFTQMQYDFQQLVEFFGDDYTKTTTEDFFGSFAVFLQHIENTKDDLVKAQNKNKERSIKASRDRISVIYPAKKNTDENSKRRISLPAVIDATVERPHPLLSSIEKSRTSSVSRTPNLSKTICVAEEMEPTPKLSLQEIAAKLSSVPKKGTLSGGSSKTAPPLVVNAWEVSVNIDADVENVPSRDANVSPRPWKASPHSSPHSSPQTNRKLRSGKDKLIETTHANDNSNSSPVDSHRFTPVDILNGKKFLTNELSKSETEREFLVNTQQNPCSPEIPIYESISESRSQSLPPLPPKPTLAKTTLVDKGEIIHKKDTMSEKINSLNHKKSDKLNEEGDFMDHKAQKKSDLPHPSVEFFKNDMSSPEVSPVKESAYNAAIKASRSPQMAPKYLNLVKAKLEEEKKKAERPKLRRKITKHEKPLYARVMKETLHDYEQQRQEDKERNANGNNSPTMRRINSPNFLTIMQQKLKEKAPNVGDDLEDVTKRKKSVTEPLYASAIRETLQDYEVRKKEHDRVRKLGVSAGTGLDISETEAGRRTPNFLSMLQENLLEKNLINKDNEDEINESLCDDEPLYALVIKAAITEYNNSRNNSNDVNENDNRSVNIVEDAVSPESQLSPISTSSTSSSGSLNNNKNNNNYDGDHSRSSSDISLASEEVSRINQRFFRTAGNKHLFDKPDFELKYLQTGIKPALPTIPSPDYTPHASDVDGFGAASNNNNKVNTENDIKFSFHPHDVDRPFWKTEKTEEMRQSSVTSSDSSAPSSPNKDHVKKPRRSSLRKKESVSKPNNVSFVKQVEVIDEIVEVDEDKVVMKDTRTESPLKGSPQIEQRRKNTPYVREVDVEVNDQSVPIEEFKTNNEAVGRASSAEMKSLGGMVKEKNIDIAFDLVTTTYPEGRMAMKLVPQGNIPISINTPEIIMEPSKNSIPETPPEINRSVKPKLHGAFEDRMKRPSPANSDDVDIRHGNETLLRTIIPSPDYSPEPSPELTRRNFHQSDRQSLTTDTSVDSSSARLTPTVKQVIQVEAVTQNSPTFVQPVEKNLINVFTEEYSVPHVILNDEPKRSIKNSPVSLPRRSPNHNTTSLSSIDKPDRNACSQQNTESPPPLPDRSKKPKKQANFADPGPPSPLPRSPNSLEGNGKPIIARFQAVLVTQNKK